MNYTRCLGRRLPLSFQRGTHPARYVVALPRPVWILRGANGRLLYPNDARGAEAAIDKSASRLPGFDYAAVVKATGLTSGGVVAWKSTDVSRSMGPPR